MLARQKLKAGATTRGDIRVALPGPAFILSILFILSVISLSGCAEFRRQVSDVTVSISGSVAKQSTSASGDETESAGGSIAADLKLRDPSKDGPATTPLITGTAGFSKQ